MSELAHEQHVLIRPIRREDNAVVARIIRDVMTEFGAVGCNFSIADPEVDAMCEAYPAPAAAFFVVESGGRVLGCGGLGPLAGARPASANCARCTSFPNCAAPVWAAAYWA
jgi:putative acetyltransferase